MGCEWVYEDRVKCFRMTSNNKQFIEEIAGQIGRNTYLLRMCLSDLVVSYAPVSLTQFGHSFPLLQCRWVSACDISILLRVHQEQVPRPIPLLPVHLLDVRPAAVRGLRLAHAQ